MTTISCTRVLEFDAGHRVCEHESKCAHLHGHRYKVWVTAETTPGAPYLDGLGRVIDFSVLKEKIGGWIDDQWDHGMILWEADPLIDEIKALVATRDETGRPTAWQKVYELPHNPTAENLARHLLNVICPQVLEGTGVRVTHVRVWETPNCAADAYLEP